MNVYISYASPDAQKYINSMSLQEGMDADVLRSAYQSTRKFDAVLLSWLSSIRGQVIICELGEGIFIAPAEETATQIERIVEEYIKEAQIMLWVGIGKSTRESQLALEWSIQHKKGVAYYDQSMIADLTALPDEPIDWAHVEGAHRPTLEEDQDLFDGLEKNEPLMKGDESNPQQSSDDGAQDEGQQSQQEGDEAQDDGQDQPVDPRQLIQEVMEETQQNLHEISVLKDQSPQVYENIVDLLRVVKAFNLMLGAGEEQQGEAESASVGGGGGDKDDSDEGQFPVGTVHKGRVKIKLPDGSTKWVSVRAGQQAGGISAKASSDYSGGNNNYSGMLNADSDGTGDEL